MKVRNFIIFGLLLFTIVNGNANDPKVPDFEDDFSNYVASLDSLVNDWHSRPVGVDLVVDTILDSFGNVDDKVTDSVYIERLSEINSPIFFPFNSQVKSYIKLYTQKRRDQMEIMLGLSKYYFPIFEEALDAAGLPLELKYLPIIESALNPRALSRAGASGLWQFMYSTGKMYGLEVNSYIDERRDPVKSTKAAVDFLSDLHEIYGDWQLVIAAYNCGPGNVNKAIRRSGGKRDFWEIYYRLPRETRGYVPAFIAATYAFTYAEEHDLHAQDIHLPVATDTIMISKPLHFSQVTDMLNLPIEVLRELNPQYRRDVIPAKTKKYPLRLAFQHATAFASYEDSIMDYRREEFFPNNQFVVAPSKASHLVVAPSGREAVFYTVKSGDVVGLIAEWFDVRASDLRYWNNINRNIIKVGQKLVIYVPKSKVSHYQAIAESHGSGQNISHVKPDVLADSDSNDFVYYTVRSGDNLWDIAKKYPGVTNDDILRLNNISDARKLKPGQRLKIKPRS